MTSVVLRSVKGSNLTPTEVDNNFTNIKTDLEAAQATISSAWTPSSTNTVTNKLLSGATNTFTSIPASAITTGQFPIARLASGVPTGNKFIRDDGTLQTIAGGGDALVANPLSQFAPTTSAQLRGVISDETGGGAAVFADSPAFTGSPTAPTASQADNSTKLATTAYVDTLGATKAAALAAVAITGANTLTQTSHFNRHVSWSGSSTAAQALSATATAGDYVEVSNDGTANLTFTGATIAPRYKLEASPGETFQAVYTAGGWVSITPIRNIRQNAQSADYTVVLADEGKQVFHPGSDGSARTFTIPANASAAFPIGAAIAFVNQNGGGVITIAITSDTMRLAGTGSTGSRSLAANGIATALKIAATEWLISGTGLT